MRVWIKDVSLPSAYEEILRLKDANFHRLPEGSKYETSMAMQDRRFGNVGIWLYIPIEEGGLLGCPEFAVLKACKFF